MVKITAIAPLFSAASSFTTAGAPLASFTAPQRSAVFATLADGQQPQNDPSKKSDIEFGSLRAGFRRDKYAREMLKKVIHESNELELLVTKDYWLMRARLERQAKAASATKDGVNWHYDPENDLTGTISSTIDPKSIFQTSTETASASTKLRGPRLNWPKVLENHPDTDASVIRSLADKGVDASFSRDQVDNSRASRSAMNSFAGAVAATQQGSGDIPRWEDDEVAPVAIPDHYMKVQVGDTEVEMNYVDIGRMSVQEAQRLFCIKGQPTPLSGNIQLAMEQMRREEQMREEQVLQLPLNDILSVSIEEEEAAGNQRQPEEEVIDARYTASYEYKLPAFVGIKGLASHAQETVEAIYNRMKNNTYKDRPLYFVEMSDVETMRAEARAEQMKHYLQNRDFFNVNF